MTDVDATRGGNEPSVEGLTLPSHNQGHSRQPPAPDPRLASTRQRDQDYLEALTERLRALGAGYYLLECWGEQEKVYRFYCQMGPRQGPGVSFEAVASDQISAVERVLDQAETWRTGGLPARTASGPRGNYR